jgi:TatD DNase family protein
LDAYIAADFYIGITGIIGNDERAATLRPLLKKIPPSRLILSSDAPYLTPFNMKK